MFIIRPPVASDYASVAKCRLLVGKAENLARGHRAAASTKRSRTVDSQCQNAHQFDIVIPEHNQSRALRDAKAISCDGVST